jgi:hypothetical protein
MAKNLRIGNVTIATSGTVSTTLSLENNRIPVAIVTPAALTGTAITFNVSDNGSTFTPLYYESTLYSLTTSTSRHHALNRVAFEGVKFLQVVSGSAEAASRTIKVISGE